MRMIPAWTSLGWPAELLFELGVAHHLRVVLERVRDLLLLGRGQDLARFSLLCERDRERGQQDRAAERQAERQPERPRAEFTPVALTRSSEIGATCIIPGAIRAPWTLARPATRIQGTVSATPSWVVHLSQDTHGINANASAGPWCLQG